MTNYEYFSGANVQIKIGDSKLLECAGISYVVQSSSQPVYSYASTKFDLMLNGREMVQGNFLVNYTKPNSILKKLIKLDQDQAEYDLSLSFNYYFDIEINFGSPHFLEYRGDLNKQIIKDCRIISRGKTIQVSDQVLLEEYTFIGRNIEIHSR
jgi:hypothetical protein